MVRDELPYLRPDLAKGLVPTDLLETSVDSFERNAQPVGRMMNLVVAKTLDAGVPLGDDVRAIRFERDDSITIDRCLEPAGRFANPAKGMLRSGWHRDELARPRLDRQGRGDSPKRFC